MVRFFFMRDDSFSTATFMLPSLRKMCRLTIYSDISARPKRTLENVLYAKQNYSSANVPELCEINPSATPRMTASVRLLACSLAKICARCPCTVRSLMLS